MDFHAISRKTTRSTLRWGGIEISFSMLWRDRSIWATILFLYGSASNPLIGMMLPFSTPFLHRLIWTTVLVSSILLHSLILSCRRFTFCSCTLRVEQIVRRCGIKCPWRSLIYHTRKVIEVVLEYM